MNIIEILKNKSLFVGFSEENLQAFAEIANFKKYNKNDIIFKEGESGDSIFIIVSGQIEVLKKNPKGEGFIVISSISGEESISSQYEGEFFGEMALLDFEPRSATIRAKTDLEVLFFSKEDLFDIFSQDLQMQLIFMTNLARTLSRMMRQTTIDIANLKLKNHETTSMG